MPIHRTIGSCYRLILLLKHLFFQILISPKILYFNIIALSTLHPWLFYPNSLKNKLII